MSRYSGRLPESYAAAEKALRGRHVRTIVNNTRVSRVDDETIEVQYHGNTIATFHADGRRRFSSCGYATTSTHERLNAMLPASVGFVRRNWTGYIETRYMGGERELVEADSITFGPDGSIHRIDEEN